MTDLSGLPQTVRKLAAELLDGQLQPVPLRDAATVALLRDGPDGLEVFMQRRASSLAFASGMHVFPGGRVEPEDADPAVPFHGAAPDPVPFAVGGDIVLGTAATLQPDQSYRALVAAAVRETVEEAGVLLARTADGPVGPGVARAVRDDLAGGATLAAALAGVDAAIDFGALIALNHWMTPAVEVRRFDTRFFAAALPPEQDGSSASTETDAAEWVQPARMLQLSAAGEVRMLPPTIAALMALAEAPTAAAVLERGHRTGLRPVLPHPYRDGDEVAWRLIDGYTGEPMDLS